MKNVLVAMITTTTDDAICIANDGLASKWINKSDVVSIKQFTMRPDYYLIELTD